MSIHIGAKPGDIAPTVLLPGDPLRARSIAERFLADAMCFNEVRAMYGYTGTYKGKRVSVMGSGMGQPTLAIYVNELINDYGVKTLIRVGTCGGLQPYLRVGDLVLAMTASTDSNMNRLRFKGMDFAPAASWDLLLKAYEAAQARDIKVYVGGMFAADSFYNPDPDWWKLWASYGALVVEMESSALYTLAARHGVDALSILTVSDNVVTGDGGAAGAGLYADGGAGVGDCALVGWGRDLPRTSGAGAPASRRKQAKASWGRALRRFWILEIGAAAAGAEQVSGARCCAGARVVYSWRLVCSRTQRFSGPIWPNERFGTARSGRLKPSIRSPRSISRSRTAAQSRPARFSVLPSASLGPRPQGVVGRFHDRQQPPITGRARFSVLSSASLGLGPGGS